MLEVLYCSYIIVMYFKNNIRINVPNRGKGSYYKNYQQESEEQAGKRTTDHVTEIREMGFKLFKENPKSSSSFSHMDSVQGPGTKQADWEKAYKDVPELECWELLPYHLLATAQPDKSCFIPHSIQCKYVWAHSDTSKSKVSGTLGRKPTCQLFL